ncbi:insulinase (Peptidase family M16) family protein [Striga asiatica]|uniref:Insulinase (Peptidase family M16) family protein n=1 Tax=Striga asiatica TaxID=4170 RepID=A0A5A7RGI3_STRAF|nr:insulinase (Peptidase family M16) family protein [Striga asiatica]
MDQFPLMVCPDRSAGLEKGDKVEHKLQQHKPKLQQKGTLSNRAFYGKNSKLDRPSRSARARKSELPQTTIWPWITRPTSKLPNLATAEARDPKVCKSGLTFSARIREKSFKTSSRFASTEYALIKLFHDTISFSPNDLNNSRAFSTCPHLAYTDNKQFIRTITDPISTCILSEAPVSIFRIVTELGTIPSRCIRLYIENALAMSRACE